MKNDVILNGGTITTIDFFITEKTCASIVKFKSLKKMTGSNTYKNICIDEYFEADGRVGGILSFDSNADEAEAIKILTFPYVQRRVLPICSFSTEKSISENEFFGMDELISKLGIKTKKGKPVDPRKLKFKIGEFAITPSSSFIFYHASSFIEEAKKFVSVEFRGTYRYGSSGVDEAKFIDRVLDLICAQEEPDAMIVDLTHLDYDFGDDIGISTYKFNKIHSPIITISNESNIEKLMGAGITCHAIEMAEAISMALEKIRN